MKCFVLVFDNGHAEVIRGESEEAARTEAARLMEVWGQYGLPPVSLQTVHEVITQNWEWAVKTLEACPYGTTVRNTATGNTITTVFEQYEYLTKRGNHQCKYWSVLLQAPPIHPNGPWEVVA